ncbi:hypothetical protein [Actinoplanes teichomyceticus]|uniref:Secreted protein n=1 Tax=Actinoplanes teichomyceticus TaxID=1867 RepID=A0A561WLC5_ACTTI|nr:hypothetical protein [Actinoplanes teichomyceticus]TWG24666.1 hypothetical protein FHX34_1021226 [Actinoplanes teichomyceticus]GIF14671.1 hypothetical protein Ate01nite_47030 [Actinoplanes teichomyceticus]
MNKTMRMLMVAGVVVGAGLAGTAGAASAEAAVNPAAITDYPAMEFFDWYPTERSCSEEAELGIDKRYWSDYRCDRGTGLHTGDWALYVTF